MIYSFLTSLAIRLLSTLSILLLLVFPTSAGEQSASPEQMLEQDVWTRSWSQDVVVGWVGLDGEFSEDVQTGAIDALIPLVHGNGHLFYFYPRFNYTDGVDPYYSLGLGYRYLFPNADVILGANIFYDYAESLNDNQYHQLGVGVEALTRWIDARANGYFPENGREKIASTSTESSSTRTSRRLGAPFATGHSILQPLTTTRETTTVRQFFNRFETPMEGFDAELGVLVPYLDRYAELRLFGGIYHFNNEFDSDFTGFRGRVELRPIRNIILDATYYEDEELQGDNWFFGVRVQLPFDLVRLARGRNPFSTETPAPVSSPYAESYSGSGKSYVSGKSYKAYKQPAPEAPQERLFARRLVEPVFRDWRLHTVESGFIEDRDAMEIEVDVESSTQIITLADTVVFVDNARGALGNPGTFEQPVLTIQTGVNTAGNLFGDRGIVFVEGTGNTYTEDVLVQANDVAIFSSATGFPALGGHRFGNSGVFPLVNGGFEVQNVGRFLLSGFSITGGLTTTSTGEGIGDGIFAENVDSLVIYQTRIANVADDGIEIDYDRRTTGQVFVKNVSIDKAANDGIKVEIDNFASARMLFDNIELDNIGSDGFDIELNDVTPGTASRSIATIIIQNSRFQNIGEDAVEVEVEDSSILNFKFQNNWVRNFGSDALEFDVEDNSLANIVILDNRLTTPPGTGNDVIEIDVDDNARLFGIIGRNMLEGTADGVDIEVDDSAFTKLLIFNNRIEKITDTAIELDVDDTGYLGAVITGNWIFGSPTDDAVELDADNFAILEAVFVGNTIIGVPDADALDFELNNNGPGGTADGGAAIIEYVGGNNVYRGISTDPDDGIFSIQLLSNGRLFFSSVSEQINSPGTQIFRNAGATGSQILFQLPQEFQAEAAADFPGATIQGPPQVPSFDGVFDNINGPVQTPSLDLFDVNDSGYGIFRQLPFPQAQQPPIDQFLP